VHLLVLIIDDSGYVEVGSVCGDDHEAPGSLTRRMSHAVQQLLLQKQRFAPVRLLHVAFM
jgi:hypothetical protein